MFDPARIFRPRAHPRLDGLEGDSAFDAEYSDWRDVDGAKDCVPRAVYAERHKVRGPESLPANGEPRLGARCLQYSASHVGQRAKPAPANVTPFMDHPAQFWVSITIQTRCTLTMRQLKARRHRPNVQPDPSAPQQYDLHRTTRI